MPPIRPIIAIKAGKCNVDGTTVMPLEEPGILYVYLNPDEELHHLCWKPRSATEPAPEDDLLIIPSDARFLRYEGNSTGRIFVLKFSSSSARHFFWLQSKSQRDNDPGFWSDRDIEWGRRIDHILQGDQEDEEMGDAPVQSAEIEQEGEESRRGGEDGGRAQSQPQGEFDLAALIRGIQVPGGQQQQATSAISLHDLLSSSSTLSALSEASPEVILELAENLPPALIPGGADVEAKRAIIRRVLQTPQFAQSLVSLSVAIREGGIGSVAESLRVPINFNEARAGADLVEVFVKGVKKQVDDENKS